jgi:NADPH:quinone reductase-like Zn-dependent oxidoreductase
MKACVLTATGGLDHVAVLDVPDPPAPGPGQVRVAIQAAALNHLDLHVVAGLPGITYRFPHILGADGAGLVESVGPGVDALRPGDRVMINAGVSCYECEFCNAGEHSLCVRYGILGEHHPGTLAQFIVVPQQNLARVPNVTPPLSWAEAAAFTLVTLTAWRMVVTRARLQAGETVLIWGIGGGVSLAALRVAKLRGARAIVTSSSDAKLDAARQLGADVTLNHRTQDVGAEVRALTKKRGVDVVVENVGDATWQTSLRCLCKGGRLVTCGATTGPLVETDVRRLFWNQYTIMGATMGNAAEYRDVVSQLARGQLRPVVDRVLSLTDVRAGFARLERGEQLGKIAITIA